jgi:hypothetical protein
MFPDWLAAMTQLPVAKAVTVLDTTVQIVGVVDLKVTGLPDPPPVASNVAVPPVTNCIEEKLKFKMLCDAIVERITMELCAEQFSALSHADTE